MDITWPITLGRSGVEKCGRNMANDTGKEWGLKNVDVTWLVTLGRSGD